jgi:hypothetical protein
MLTSCSILVDNSWQLVDGLLADLLQNVRFLRAYPNAIWRLRATLSERSCTCIFTTYLNILDASVAEIEQDIEQKKNILNRKVSSTVDCRWQGRYKETKLWYEFQLFHYILIVQSFRPSVAKSSTNSQRTTGEEYFSSLQWLCGTFRYARIRQKVRSWRLMD